MFKIMNERIYYEIIAFNAYIIFLLLWPLQKKFSSYFNHKIKNTLIDSNVYTLELRHV